MLEKNFTMDNTCCLQMAASKLILEQMEILLFTEYQMVLQCGLQMLRVFRLFILLLSKVQKDKT
jgi:hypothetical protein